MTVDLDKAVAELRRPFTPAAVKFKPLTKPNGTPPKSSAAFYIDARLAAERLNAAVGAAGWSDEYDLIAEGRETPALYYPVVCRLTVCGVTKTDVGQGANTVVDDKAWKSAYSDALKRAAVKFGVGAYLYAIPRLYAPVDVGNDGKAKGFTKEGKAYLLSSYERWLKSPLNTFGEPLDHGDVADDDDPEHAPTPEQGNGTAPAAKPAAAKPGPSKDDEAKLLALITEKDGDVAAATAAMETARSTESFADWFQFQYDHWLKQPKPFKAPAGVTS